MNNNTPFSLWLKQAFHSALWLSLFDNGVDMCVLLLCMFLIVWILFLVAFTVLGVWLFCLFVLCLCYCCLFCAVCFFCCCVCVSFLVLFCLLVVVWFMYLLILFVIRALFVAPLVKQTKRKTRTKKNNTRFPSDWNNQKITPHSDYDMYNIVLRVGCCCWLLLLLLLFVACCCCCCVCVCVVMLVSFLFVFFVC